MEPQNAIYDARQLGTPRMLILGFQHLFAMFGATVLVPLLTGDDFFWNMKTGKIIPYRLIKESLENYKGNH